MWKAVPTFFLHKTCVKQEQGASFSFFLFLDPESKIAVL